MTDLPWWSFETDSTAGWSTRAVHDLASPLVAVAAQSAEPAAQQARSGVMIGAAVLASTAVATGALVATSVARADHVVAQRVSRPALIQDIASDGTGGQVHRGVRALVTVRPAGSRGGRSGPVSVVGLAPVTVHAPGAPVRPAAGRGPAALPALTGRLLAHAAPGAAPAPAGTPHRAALPPTPVPAPAPVAAPARRVASSGPGRVRSSQGVPTPTRATTRVPRSPLGAGAVSSSGTSMRTSSTPASRRTATRSTRTHRVRAHRLTTRRVTTRRHTTATGHASATRHG